MSTSFFTTGLILDASLVFWEDHLDRIRCSLNQVNAAVPTDFEEQLRQMIHAELPSAHAGARRFRISFDMDSHHFKVAVHPIEQFPQPAMKARSVPVESPFWYQRGVKSEDRKTYENARRDASAKDGELLLLVHPETGMLQEFDIGNILINRKNRWILTPDNESGLAGICRNRVKEYLLKSGEDLEILPIHRHDLRPSDRLLCCNASRLLFPISGLDGSPTAAADAQLLERISGFIHFAKSHATTAKI